MRTTLLALVSITLFTAYGFLAVVIWSWLAKKRISFARSGQSPGFGDVVMGIVLGLVLGCLPPAALIFVARWSESQLSIASVVVFCIFWAISAVPGAVRSRRIMSAAGLDPDAA